jgi:hypothetical protein
MNEDIKKYFNENGYVVINQYLPETMVNIMYSYTLKKVNRLIHKMQTKDNTFYNVNWDGFLGDETAGLNSLNFYGDELTETLLEATLPFMQEFTGLNLVPTYSFLRLYQKGDILPYHTDRESCEISTTVCLGHNTENIDHNKYTNYNWPIFVKNNKGENIPISLKPGDMLIYKGIEVPHWREKFLGNNHAQAFLHYNRKEKLDNNYLDKRKNLGLPKHIIKI